MSTIGQQLKVPETGWKRVLYNNEYIMYSPNVAWMYDGTSVSYHKTSGKFGTAVGESLVLKFRGTKVRFIGSTWSTCSNNISVIVDGVLQTSLSTYGANASYIFLYELTGLSDSIHTIELLNNTGNYLAFYAFDVDDNATLIGPVDPPQNLTATLGDHSVNLLWGEVAGAASYNVKRAANSDGPYTTIASNITLNSYVDANVENSVTYYYVVTAVVGGVESDNSNEVAATPVDNSGTNVQAFLKVTMIDSSEREYQLTITEIDSFISWFNNHMSGDSASYMLNKNVGLRNSKEYLAFDKIISFEVIPVAE